MLDWHWLVSIFGIFCFWVFTSVRKVYKQINKRNSKVPDIKILMKIIPLSCDNGWNVSTVNNGVPIWNYSTTFTFSPKYLLASCTTLPMKSSSILKELINIKVFSMIFPDFPSFKVETGIGDKLSNRDVLSCSNLFANLSLPNLLLSGQHTVLTFERYWFNGSNMSWLYVCPTVQLLSSKYGYWICFIMQDKEGEQNSILHILASYPESVSNSTMSEMISSCQVLISYHMDSLHTVKVNSIPDSDNDSQRTIERKSRKPLHKDSVKASSLPTTSQSFSSPTEGYGKVEEPAIIERITDPEKLKLSPQHSPAPSTVSKPFENHQNVSPLYSNDVESLLSTKTPELNTPPPQAIPVNKIEAEISQSTEEEVQEFKENKKLLPYLKQIKESHKSLFSCYLADENTPGWELYNEKDGVTVHKKSADGLLFINDAYKGKTTVKVPFPYLANYVLNVEYKPEYDGVFETGYDIEELGDGVTKIAYLGLKNVWPTTGRDFCSLSAPRHIKDNLYGITFTGVTHPNCPDKKAKVRGEVKIGGYVFEDVSTNPPITNITYITCVDPKGYIPSKIVSKVSSDQALSVGIIRKKVEYRYKIQDPPTNGKSWTNWLERFKSVPSIFPKPKPEIIAAPTVTVNNINNNTEPIVTMETEPVVSMVTEPVITAEDETEMEMQPTDSLSLENGINILTNNDEHTSNEKETIIDDPIPANNNSTNMSGAVVDNVNEGNRLEDICVPEATADHNSPTIKVLTSDIMLSNGFDMMENHYSDVVDKPLELPKKSYDESSEDESLGDLSQFTDTDSMYQSQVSVSDQPIELPRDESGQIDFITLGNQAAAALEEEFFIARKVDTSVKNDGNKQETDVWKYQGTSKDVIMMRKRSSTEKVHSFLGRGIISVLPVTVFEMIKNPTTRFVYDNMLKKIKTVKQINDKSKIINMRHETHACFVKQARDFCMLLVERTKQQRYVFVGTSVEIPECPPENDCVRGKIHSSGWVIEPIMQNGKSCSLVTYISQIDFGGRLPTRLINFIAKRQPLAIAYLRTYLETAEM